jgi:hypothetical protein
MKDPRLHELINAYTHHELDFDEYRRQRTEYIDQLTGAADEPSAQMLETDAVGDQPENISSASFRHNQLLWLGVVIFAAVMLVFAIIKY